MIAQQDLLKTISQTSPRQAVMEMVLGYVKPQLIYVAARLGLADHLSDGPKTLDELAPLVKAEPDALSRLLRGLINIGLLCQIGEKEFALSGLGECLVSDRPGSLREVAILQGEEMYQAWGNLFHTVQTGESAFEKTFGMEFFYYLEHHPSSQRRFNHFMANTSCLAARAFQAAYDFSSYAKLVDVGGGRGVLLATLLKANPHLTGILYESGEATTEANSYLQSEGVAARCRVAQGDFFEEVPEGGDLYILSQIIHDWDDARAVTLLKNCRQAMPSEARLLLFEHIMPSWIEPPCKAVQQDLCMMVLTGGRERTEEEFGSLLRVAGFELTQIIPTRHSRCILEAVPLID